MQDRPKCVSNKMSEGAADWIDQLFCEDALQGLARITEGAADLLIADSPYGLIKDYGNDSDKMAAVAYLAWMDAWITLALLKLKANGSLYIFLTWRYAPKVFVILKQRLTMMNEIIWDRRVPSMGGSTRRYYLLHDTIGFFVKAKDYYGDLEAIRIAYNAVTKKARSRSIFVGAKWLELGYNPKDVWSISRPHLEHREHADHPAQKPLAIIERMIRASYPSGGVVLDPFMGSVTIPVAAQQCDRRFVGFELNPGILRIDRKTSCRTKCR